MTENRIERALEDDYLSRDPSTSKRVAYIRRTMEKARRWAERSALVLEFPLSFFPVVL